MFVVISTYRNSVDEVLPLVPQHNAWVGEHYESGRILVSGIRVPQTGGVLVVRGTDVAEVQRWMASDPFVQEDVVGFEVYEFAETDFPNRSAAFDAFMSEVKV